MIESKKDFLYACLACGIVAFFLVNLSLDSQGAINVAPTLLVLAGLEGAMVFFLWKRLRNDAGKTQLSLLTAFVIVLAIGLVMAMNIGRWKYSVDGAREYGWPWKAFASSWNIVTAGGRVIHVPWRMNYSYLLIDGLMAACIVTACLILSEAFIRLKRQRDE